MENPSRSHAPRVCALVVIAVLQFTAACGGPGSSATPPAGPEAVTAQEPWTVQDARVETADGLRVLVLHDMEGLSGQDDWRTFDFQHKEPYARGQEMLAGDVNAVIDGLFAGGATEVQVVDGHGSGNPDPDVRADLLDKRATQLVRKERFDTYFDVPESERYDAVAVVGMHAKTGSRGFASHTFTLGIELQINGRPITETELVALSWGRYGVPVIFASGDDRLAADLATMPWIEFVTVKTATSASTAQPRPVDEARAELREAARRAVASLDDARFMRVAEPLQATIRTVPPASLGRLKGVPGVRFDAEANSVTFQAATLREAYDGLVALVDVATTEYPSVLREVLRARGLGDEMSVAYNDALVMRWLDVESGRWSPTKPAPDTERRYHGYQ